MRHVLAAVALLLIPGTAEAHTTAQLDAWVEEWQTNRPWTVESVEAWRIMAARHPDYFKYSEPAEPSASPTRSVRPAPAGSEPWRTLVSAYFPAAEVDRALCIIYHESRGNPSAVSPTDDHGLFQIHAPIWGPHFGVSRTDLYNPDTNTRVAAAVWASQGWRAWSPYKRGECR